jgi:hypothetical protein
MGATTKGTSQTTNATTAGSPARTTIRLTVPLQAACAAIREQALEIRMLSEANLEVLTASTTNGLPYPLPQGKWTKAEASFLTAYAQRHLGTALFASRELNFPADYPDDILGFSVQVIGDDDPPFKAARLSKALEEGMAWIKRQALKTALAPADDDDPILTGPHANLELPRGNWTKAERTTLEAHARYCFSAALSYRDNPRPFGPAASDPSAWLRMFSAGLQTGTQRQSLHEMPRWWSHLLETAKTSGSVLMLPHPAHADTTPRYLRREEIARRFGVDEIMADELKFYFEVLELDEKAVESYAAQVRRITMPEQCKQDRLGHTPGLHPFALRMQLRAFAGDIIFNCGWPTGLRGRVAEFLSDYLVELREQPRSQWQVSEHIAELAEHGPAETDRSVPFYDADLGRADRDQLTLEAADGGMIETAEQYEAALDDADDPDLVLSGSVDEEEELSLDGDLEEPVTDGHFETIAYHRIGRGDTETDELDGDQLYAAITTAKPQEIAALKKELWTQEKNAPRSRTRFAWTILWTMLKAREGHFAHEHHGLKLALRDMESANSFGKFRRLGAKVFADSKTWPAFARKQFWAAYNEKKVEWEAKEAARTASQTRTIPEQSVESAAPAFAAA